MIKILRVFAGTAVGLWIAEYLGFIGIAGILNYLLAALVVMGVVFVVKGFNF